MWQRLTKSPKVYVRDTGLLHHLLNISSHIEMKVGSGAKTQAVRSLEQAALDMDAATVWIIGQADGTDPLPQNIQRRGFAEKLDWLPPEADQKTRERRGRKNGQPQAKKS